MWHPATLIFFIMSSVTLATICPEHCTCSSGFKRVSCIKKGLDKPPDGIPVEVTELYLAQNKFSTLRQNFLPNLPNLIILDLKGNYISDIQPNAFSNLPKLEKLFLTNNALSQVTAEAFHGLANLGHLYLSQNKLTTIPDLEYIANLTYIAIDYNKLTSAKFTDTSSSLKNLKSIILSQNPIGSLKSEDFIILANSPVSNFNLNNCQLKYVENNTFEPFKSLQSLSLSYNMFVTDDPLWSVISSLSGSISSLDLSGSIHSLPRGVFHSMASSKNFRTLTLRHCDIQVLLNDIFTPLSFLYNLDFAYSSIAKVENGAFAPLTSLKQLNLGYNRLDTLPTPFPKKLETLDLSNNHGLTEIPKHSFPVSAKLTTLKLSYCSLMYIYKDSFKYLSNLTSLDLSNNQIAETSIAKDSFVDMVSLNHLDLSKNKLKQITTNAGVFNGLSSLKTLNMSSNDCSQLPKAVFDPLSGLQILDLRLNSLGTFLSIDDNPLFSKLARLYSLNLVSNELPILTDSVFQGLKNISQLFLSNNRITHWEPSTFRENKKLTYLDLSTNSISVVNSTSVEFFSANTTLNLNDNPFYCWCELVWFRNWLNKTEVKFQNLSQYKCTSPREVAQSSLIHFVPSKIETACNPPYKWVAIATAGVVFVLVTVLAILLYRLRWKIFLCWYKTRCCCCCRSELSDEEKPLLNPGENFNATILYGPDDASSDFVKYTFYEHVKNTLGLTPFIEDEHILLGSPYSEQIGKTYGAISTSSYIFVVMSDAFIRDGRRYYEMDLTAQRFDKARATNKDGGVTIIPIIFSNGTETEGRVRLQINKLFGRRCDDRNVLYWSPGDDAAQTLFMEKLQDIARYLNIIG